MTTEMDAQVKDISDEEQEYLERTALLGLEYVLADFVREFQSATKRWERIAFPAMVIFALLAISGFWLIYSITEDMTVMSKSMDPQMSQNLGTMSQNIASLTNHIEHMDKNFSQLVVSIDQMNVNISNMDSSMAKMQRDISGMSVNISNMNQSITAMTWNTGVMSDDMNRLNRSIGKPMRFMNNFLP
jgi:septal ring factor EnvC (AmiA/AmiB activator)